MYVFKVKNGAHKVIIVAEGFCQMHGVCYHKTFTPIERLAVVRFFIVFVSLLSPDGNLIKDDFFKCFKMKYPPKYYGSLGLPITRSLAEYTLKL